MATSVTFEEAVDLYYAAVLDHATRHSNEPDDVTQETFIEAWKSWDTLDTTRPIWNWLFGVMMHRAHSRRRAERAWLLYETALGKADLPPHRWLAIWAGTNNPPASHGDETLESWLREVGIPSLTPKTRRLAAAFYIEKLTDTEIAKRYGMTKGGVAAGLHRAREKLKGLAGL